MLFETRCIKTWVSNASNEVVLWNWPLQIIKFDWCEQACLCVGCQFYFLRRRNTGCSAKHPERSFSAKETDFARPSVACLLVSRLWFPWEFEARHTEPILVDPGAKINGYYYQNAVLTQHLLPAMRHVSGNIQEVRISISFRSGVPDSRNSRLSDSQHTQFRRPENTVT